MGSPLGRSNLRIQNLGIGPASATVCGFQQPQIGRVADMEVSIIVEHILLYPCVAAQLRAVDLVLCGAIIEVIVSIYKVAALTAVLYFQNRSISFGSKIPHIIQVVVIGLIIGTGIDHHTRNAVQFHIAGGGLGRLGRSIQGNPAREQVHHQINGVILAADHQRINKCSRLGMFGVCAVVEIVRKAVAPRSAVVRRHTENRVQGAGVTRMVPAGVAGGNQRSILKCNQGGNAEIVTARRAGCKGLAHGSSRFRLSSAVNNDSAFRRPFGAGFRNQIVLCRLQLAQRIFQFRNRGIPTSQNAFRLNNGAGKAVPAREVIVFQQFGSRCNQGFQLGPVRSGFYCRAVAGIEVDFVLVAL